MVVWNDHEAVRLATVLSRAGVRVPEQVSLVGYDNLPESSLIYPLLTTIDQAIGQQLRLALRLLTQPVPPAPLAHDPCDADTHPARLLRRAASVTQRKAGGIIAPGFPCRHHFSKDLGHGELRVPPHLL